MSDTQLQPFGIDMSLFGRLVRVAGGPVTGTFWVRRPSGRETVVTAVDVTVWADDAHTCGRNIRDMAALVEGSNVRLGYIDPHVRDDVLDRSDDVRAAVLAAARAAEWWH